MPPPITNELSDEESGDIPFKNGGDEPEDNGDDGQDENDEDEDEEGVYIVESIRDHKFLPNGKLQLLVKWRGYEELADHTWEPEENLEEVEALAEYYEKLGGRPQKPAGKSGPGRKRKSMGETQSTSAPAAAQPKKQRRSTKAEDANSEAEAEEEEEDGSWVPKGKNWDKELDSVDTIIRDQDNNGLYAFLLWNNGKRSRVSIESCYEKCPMKMLEFYESHLVFKEA